MDRQVPTFHLRNYFWVTGLRRSGNHAIQTWLTGLVGDPFVKLNWTPVFYPPKVEIIRKEYRGPETSLIQGAEELRSFDVHGPTCINLVAENMVRVLILRHPYNNFASMTRFNPNYLKPEITKIWLDLWAKYADEFLGNTNELSNKVQVCYDKWFASESYRRAIAAQLHVEFNDSKLNEMDTDWGVSSFDEYEYQGRAQEMDVLSRWKIMIGDSQFHQFLDSFEKHRAAVLADGIFGPVPIVT